MTEKQRLLCENYLVCKTLKQAALDAGYSLNTIRGSVYRIFKSPEVQEYIAKRTREIAYEHNVASPEEVLGFLTAVMRGEEVDQAARSVKGKRVFEARPPSLKDRVAAASLLGKRYALFVDRVGIEEPSKVVFSEVDVRD